MITSITTEDDTNEPVTDPEPAQQDLAEQVTALTAQVNELTEQVSSLKNENEALKGDNETLTAEAKTEEEKEILDIVSKAGGKKWLDSLKGVRSTFNANNRSFVEHGSKTAVQQETTTQRLIREQREKQEARRAASKK